MEQEAELLIHKLINAVIDMKPSNNHFGFDPNLSRTFKETLSCRPVISMAFAITKPP